MTNEEFRSAMGCFVTGVTVVTGMHNNRLIGVTANSLSSVSLKPPLVLWSLSKSSQKYLTMISMKNYAINILSNSQKEIAMRFSHGEEPFMDLDFCFNELGVPLIKNSMAVVECERYAVYDGGDHSIILGQVKKCAKSKLEPLIFLRGKLE